MDHQDEQDALLTSTSYHDTDTFDVYRDLPDASPSLNASTSPSSQPLTPLSPRLPVTSFSRGLTVQPVPIDSSTSSAPSDPALPPSYTTAVPRPVSSPPKYATAPSSSERALLLASPPSFEFAATRCIRCDVENVARCNACRRRDRRNSQVGGGADLTVTVLIVLNCIVWGLVVWTYLFDPELLHDAPGPVVGGGKGYGWALEDYCDVAMRNRQ